MARIEFTDAAERYAGVVLPVPGRPTMAELAQACRYWRCTSQQLAAMMDSRSPEFNDMAATQLMLFMALSRSGRTVSYAECGERWFPGDDFRVVEEPGDERAEGEAEGEDPRSAPSGSASDEGGATATGRHSLPA